MDLFLAHPPLQPKLAVAQYVASQGFAVPQIYASFDEALASGEPFIARSEHPQDYAGVSGLLESFEISPVTLEEARSYGGEENPSSPIPQFLRALQKRLLGGSDRAFELDLARIHEGAISQFCKHQVVTEQSFLDNVSYSYWKLLGGYNQTMIADNAVAGRYHLFSVQAGEPFPHRNYSIVDQGIVQTVRDNRPFSDEGARLLQGAATCVRYYDSIRSLPLFDPSHCPTIECQWVNGIHSFLQYHWTRDFEPARFRIDRGPGEGEREAFFVRGATPPEGMTVETAFYYPYDSTPRLYGLHGPTPLPQHEGGSFDFLGRYNRVVAEIMMRRRDIFFMHFADLSDIGEMACAHHLPRSFLFKPRLSVAADFRDLRESGLFAKARDETFRTGIPFRIPIRVVSDGRRALVKVMR